MCQAQTSYLWEYLEQVTPITDDYIDKHPDFKVSNMSYEDFREDLDNLLKNIENGSNRINRIVCDLKEFSKRKDTIKRDWFDLNKIIEKAVTICGSKINGLTDSIEIIGTQDLSPVYCDHEIVELILVNFLIRYNRKNIEMSEYNTNLAGFYVKYRFILYNHTGRAACIATKIMDTILTETVSVFLAVGLVRGGGLCAV